MGDKDYSLTITLPSLQPDLSFLIYPLHVLTTNRIVNTAIFRRQHTSLFRFHKDFSDLRKINGVKGWFAGIVPFTLSYFVGEESGNMEESKSVWPYLTFLLTYNPL